MAKTSLLLAAFAASINAIAAPKPEITPPPLARREPKLDPPYDVLGPPDQYIITNLGPDTSIISYDGNVYHYIEGHTKYFSEETITTTIDNTPTTTVTTDGVVASTVATAVGDLNAGDVSLTFSEKIAEGLTSSAKEAAAACGLSANAKKAKRLDSLQCIVDNAVKLSGTDGPLEAAAADEFWASLAIDLAANAPELLSNAIAVIKSQAQKKKALIMIAAIVAAPKIKDAIAALSVPAKGVGSKSENDDDNDQKCDPNKEADENSPLCQDCKGDEEKEKCTEGGDKGCPCLIVGDTHTEQFDKAWADEQQKILTAVIAGIDNPDPDFPEAKCDKDEPKKFSAAVFNAGVYKRFCQDISKDPKSSFYQIVDVRGDYIPPKRARSSLVSRAEPVDLKPYEDYRFALDWTGGDGSCNSDCAKVYSAMSESSCWHTAGDSNTLGIMATEAKLDTGCGTYSYKIDVPPIREPPPPPPEDDPPPEEITVGSRQCINDPGNIGCWKDVHAGKVDETADEFEKHFNTQNEVMNSDTKNITQVLREGGQSGSGVTYMMNIGWIPGCDMVKEQDAKNPVPNDQSVGWKDLLKDNYYQCTANNGLGGWTDVGCLRYGFYPNNAGVFASPPHPENFFQTMSYCG